VRHRLNQRGNRQLNHAMHLAAIVQMRHDGPGQTYYDRKIAEGKRPQETMRSAEATHQRQRVYRHLVADAARH